jgi:hypothetical protein
VESNLVALQKVKCRITVRSKHSTQKNGKQGLSVLVHACNPSHSRGRSRRIIVLDRSREKHETISEKQTKAKELGG